MAEAGRRIGVSRQAVEQQFLTFRAHQARNRAKMAVNAATHYIDYCRSIGFKENELDGMERLWWNWHDENGNLLKQPRRWHRSLSY